MATNNTVKAMLKQLLESTVQSDVTLVHGLQRNQVHANIISHRSPIFKQLVDDTRDKEREILCGKDSVIAKYLKDLDTEGNATAHMDMIRSHWIPPITIALSQKTTISRYLQIALVDFMYTDEYTIPAIMTITTDDPNPDTSNPLNTTITTPHPLTGRSIGLVFHILVYLAALKSWTQQTRISRFDIPTMAVYAQAEYRKALKKANAWNSDYYALVARLLWEETTADEEKDGLNMRKDVAVGYANHIEALHQNPKIPAMLFDLEGFESYVW